MENPVDAVITWVDGNDVQHRKRRMDALKGLNVDKNELATGRDPTRFLDNGELFYCIRSIRTFAPWIRTIHVVTDNQVPGFLTPDMRKRYNIRVVDHREIFKSFEWVLPTFNNRTIETALWRIPGLAPYFLYFNDDFVLTQDVTPEHFFRDGKVVLRGSWNSMISYGHVRMKINALITYLAKKLFGITRSMHLLQQMRSARLAGFTSRYYRIPHVPHPVRTDTLRRWFTDHPSSFHKNIEFKFRNMGQFSAIFLAHHLEIRDKNAILSGTGDLVMINGEMDISFSMSRKLQKIENKQVFFACLHGIESFKKPQSDRIKQTLDKLLEAESV